MVGGVKGPILHDYTKFDEDRSSRCWDTTIFWFSSMAAAAILDFHKFKILTVSRL